MSSSSCFLMVRRSCVATACWVVMSGAAQAEEPAPAALPTVVVTATMTERDRLSSPAFTSVMTAEDIARSPANSLPDVLRDTVGVSNQTDGNGRDELQIRGLDGRYTLILVNGKRVSSAGALWRGSDFDLSTIPLGSIERIEVVRGPMSALYGSDAMGGVINIITRRAGKAWQGAVGADYRVVQSGAEGNQWRVNATAAGELSEGVSLALSGEIYDRQPWYQTRADDPTEAAALEGKRSANFAATLSVQLDNRQGLDIDLGYNHDKRPYALTDYVYYPAWNYEKFSYSEQELDRHSLGITHTGKWAWGRTFTSLKREQAAIRDHDTDYDDPKKRRYEENNTYFRSFGVIRLGAQTLTLGVDARQQQIQDAATYLSTGEIRTTQTALFAQDELRMGDDWLLTLGGRLDRHPDFGHHLSPKAYLNYFMADGVAIKGGVSTAFKAPDPYQLSEQYRIVSCGGSCHLSGNPDLTPEKSTSFELGVEITRPAWSFSAALFRNDVKDMIVAVYDAAGPSREWRNVARAKTRGLELDGGWRLTPALSLKGNLTLLKADYTDATGTTVKLEHRPEQKGMVGLDWQITPIVSANVSASYTGKQYDQEEALPAYTRLDVGGTARVSKALTVRAGVKNLTDVNLQDKNVNFVAHELGRNYYVSMAYAF